jgi:hypothetical protein
LKVVTVGESLTNKKLAQKCGYVKFVVESCGAPTNTPPPTSAVSPLVETIGFVE